MWDPALLLPGKGLQNPRCTAGAGTGKSNRAARHRVSSKRTFVIFLFSFEVDASLDILKQNKDWSCHHTSVAFPSSFQLCTELCQLQDRIQNSDNLFFTLLESVMNFIALEPAIHITCLLISSQTDLRNYMMKRSNLVYTSTNMIGLSQLFSVYKSPLLWRGYDFYKWLFVNTKARYVQSYQNKLFKAVVRK